MQNYEELTMLNRASKDNAHNMQRYLLEIIQLTPYDKTAELSREDLVKINNILGNLSYQLGRTENLLLSKMFD